MLEGRATWPYSCWRSAEDHPGNELATSRRTSRGPISIAGFSIGWPRSIPNRRIARPPWPGSSPSSESRPDRPEVSVLGSSESGTTLASRPKSGPGFCPKRSRPAKALRNDGGDVDPKALFDRWRQTPTHDPTLSSALDELARLASDRPELTSPALTLGSLLKAAFHPPEPVTVDPSDLTLMARGWPQGRPAFHERPPRLVESILTARSRGLAEALSAENPSARLFNKALRTRKIDLVTLANEAVGGRPDEIARSAEAAGLDQSLASSILRLSLLPSLAPISAELDQLRPEAAWDRGDCPHCGSRPLLAESRGLEQRIAYRCGLCAADWPGERLRCPSCGENSPKALAYSYVEGEQDRYRLAHCQACRYDWKVVSTLTALSPPALIVVDLATFHLDVLAQE
jgi:Protein involved in formate dehydrogenase formation